MNVKDLKLDKEALVKEILTAGGRPAGKNMWHCCWHKDGTASAWVKQSSQGYYYKCFTCNKWADIFDLQAQNTGKSVEEVIKEAGYKAPPRQYVYKTREDLIASLEAVAIEEENPYTNPDTEEVELLTIRYLPRGGVRKQFAQAYHNGKGWVKKRPPGLLPLFNRVRIRDASTVIFVEGEKKVRALTKLGIPATCGSGGASNADAHDYSPLKGKTVILWPDNDDPGFRFMEQVREHLLKLEPAPTIFTVNVPALELEVGEDVCDVIEKVKIEGGSDEDCKIHVELILAEAEETNRLKCLEDMLEGMRSGDIQNLPIKDLPLLTNEAMTLLNEQVSVLYGNAGFGKTLLVGKLCDDLVLSGHNVARLQLEDPLSKHLLRTMAQQIGRSEVTKPKFHKENVDESRRLEEEHKPLLDTISATIMADEMREWTVDSILQWVEQQLKAGKELIVIDPISVIMTKDVYLASHKFMWGVKRLLKQYPKSRVLVVSHPNSEGEVSGGQAYKRFCNNLLILNKFKMPKTVEVIDKNGNMDVVSVNSSIGIVKTRDGSGTGLEIAVRLNPETICIEEIGIILRELKDEKVAKQSGRNLEEENKNYHYSL